MKRIIPHVLILALTFTSAQAIVIRHDRDEADYRKLASKYTMVGEVGGAMGTLIDPQWVLTAGHVAEGMPAGGTEVRFGDRVVRVDRVVIHPGYGDETAHRDLALIHLVEPVSDIPPATLYRDFDETGQLIVFVGTGDFGNGKTGPTTQDGIMRAAHNRVVSTPLGWLTFNFDAPPRGEQLEGISGPGDSGGPALIERTGKLYIAGVSAFNDGEPPCTYGSVEYYARVSDEIEWIERVMAGNDTASRRLTTQGGGASRATDGD